MMRWCRSGKTNADRGEGKGKGSSRAEKGVRALLPPSESRRLGVTACLSCGVHPMAVGRSSSSIRGPPAVAGVRPQPSLERKTGVRNASIHALFVLHQFSKDETTGCIVGCRVVDRRFFL